MPHTVVRRGLTRRATALATARGLTRRASALATATVTSAATGALLAGSLVAGSSASAAAPSSAAAPPGQRTSYVNPVSKRFADTFADPSVIRGKDGWWYAFGTSDPLREGEGTAHRLPVARSRDLVSWTHTGDAFTTATLPKWAAPNASIWAPD